MIQEALALNALLRRSEMINKIITGGTCGAGPRPAGRSLSLSAGPNMLCLRSKMPSEANVSLARAKSSCRLQNVRDTCEVEQTLGRHRRPRRPLAAENVTIERYKDERRIF